MEAGLSIAGVVAVVLGFLVGLIEPGTVLTSLLVLGGLALIVIALLIGPSDYHSH